MTHLTPPTESESEKVAILSSMMGDAVDSVVALRVLRKYGGSVEKAADAMLGGDRGVQEPIPVVQSGSNQVIDLTGEGEDQDEEMRRALKMSMETEGGEQGEKDQQGQTQFGPSTREPSQNWAVVPTNPQQQLSNEEENLKQAIQASLAIPEGNENETLDMADMVRQDGRPVSFRPDLVGHVYAALVIHALFHVPQIRQRAARYRSPSDDQKTKDDETVESLVSLYTHLDHAALSTIDDNYVFELLNITPHDQIRPVHELCQSFVANLATLLEDRLPAGEEEGRLITFSAGRIEVINGQARFDTDGKPLSNVPLNVNSNPNQLVAHLAAMLNTYSPDGSSVHEGIQEPSEVIVFLLNHDSQAGAGKVGAGVMGEAEGFVYPKTMYMDQFLLGNYELAQEKREMQRRVRERVGELRRQRDGIVGFNNKDTIRDMKNSLYYYENVAKAGEDRQRQEVLESTKEKLRKMVDSLEAVIGNINAEIERLQNEDKTIFDCPELQKHQYDLRAVLMHTGVPGRKQMYSYVQDQDGLWWKTVDHLVTEATEADVLTDPTGLHLRAGPFMLIYSRTVSREQEQERNPLPWPREIVDSVKANNEQFLATLEPEMRDKYLASRNKEKRDMGLERKPTVLEVMPQLEAPKETVQVQDVSMMDLTASTSTAGGKE